MTVEQAALWATITATMIALVALAWAAVNYVLIRKREQQFLEYKKFFEIMDQLGNEGGSIASKMAALYELRKYPDYKEVIIRLVDKAEVHGGSAQMLREEMDLTKEFFLKN